MEDLQCIFTGQNKKSGLNYTARLTLPDFRHLVQIFMRRVSPAPRSTLTFCKLMSHRLRV